MFIYITRGALNKICQRLRCFACPMEALEVWSAATLQFTTRTLGLYFVQIRTLFGDFALSW